MHLPYLLSAHPLLLTTVLPIPARINSFRIPAGFRSVRIPGFGTEILLDPRKSWQHLEPTIRRTSVSVLFVADV